MRLIEARKRARLTQVEVARRLGNEVDRAVG
jgi:hypothetical protein